MKSTVVFYVSDTMVKFLQVTGQKKTVVAMDVIATDQMTDLQLSERLGSLAKKMRLKSPGVRVIVVVPRIHLILRYMTFPSVQEHEIRSMIDLQVGEHMPYAREEVEIDFQILEKTPEGYSKVVVVIIPQDVAMRYWKIFSNAQIRVDQMTISPVGLWLLYKQQNDSSGKLGAIFDLEAKRSEICVCRNEFWLTSREIPIGLNQIEREGPGDLLKQWDLTRDHIAKDKVEEQVDLVYLVASTDGQTQTLENAMEQEQGVAIKHLDLLRKIPIAKNVAWSKRLMGEEISMAPLVGIAFGPSTPPVDLVPQSVREQQKQNKFRGESVECGIWAVLALVLCVMALSMNFVKKTIDIGQLEEELKFSKSKSAKVEKQIKQVHDSENMFRHRLIFNDLAQEISRLLPPQLSLVSISITDGKVLSLQGTSSKPGDINQLQKDLVESPFFANVNLDFVDKRITQEGEINSFKITCAVESAKGPNDKTE